MAVMGEHACGAPTEQQAAGRNFGHCEQLQVTKKHQGKTGNFEDNRVKNFVAGNAHPSQPLQLAAPQGARGEPSARVFAHSPRPTGWHGQ